MLKLRLIGLPALIGNDGTTSPLERKDAALLAILAIDGATARDALATLLWPEVALKTANTSLRQRVFRLRKRSDGTLLHTGAQLQLAADVRHDATMAPADDAEALPAGELLGGFSYADCDALADWVRAARERWRGHRRDALATAAARHEAAGELARAIELAQRLVAEEPLAEHPQRRLMRLHYLRGDRAAAIAAFEHFERALKDELGTRPGAETLELLTTIEHAQPARPARRALVPAALRRPPRMIGRDAELAALDAAWAAGRVFLVLGEAGMGKSRLLAEFAASRGDCVIAQARPGDAAVPFALLARLLRAAQEATLRPANDATAVVPALDEPTRHELARVLPELGSGLAAAGEGRRLLLQRAIETLLAALHARGLAALLVDDLHFADAASLELLQSLPAAERLAALHWGLAQRPGEGGAAARALADALQETQRLQQVPLAPLDAAAMRALVDSLGLPELDAAALAAPLVRHTGGNPLYALETLKEMVVAGVAAAGGLPQPATVGVLIERRLAQLSAPALSLARVAAIAGVDFSIELAERVLQTPALALADAWRELESSQVLVGTAFAHDLVYEAALRSVPAEIARHVHAAVAEHLQARSGEPARLALHWEAAGHDQRAGAAWRAAAQAALAGGRREDEVRLLARAADCFTRAARHDDAFEADLARVIGSVTVEGAEAGLALADRLVAQARTLAQRAAALTRRASVLQWLVRAADAAEACAEVLALAEQGDRSGAGDVPVALATRLFAVGIRASSLASLGQAGAGAQLMATWGERARTCNDAEARLVFFGTYCTVLTYANRRREAVSAGERHIALARTAGRRDELLSGLTNVSAAQVFLGRLDHAIALAREAQQLADSLGQDRAAAAVNAANLGWYLVAAGSYGEGLGLIEDALEALRTLMPTSAFVANVECFLADALIALGQPARAAPLLDDGDDQRLPSFLRAKRLLGRVRAARAAARPAPELIERGLALAQGDAGLPVKMALLLEQALLQAPQAALALCDQVLADAERTDAPLHRLLALARRIEPLLQAGDAAAAAAVAQRVQADAAQLHGPGLYPPELQLLAGRALVADARYDEARAALAEALAWIDARVAGVPPGFRDSFLHRNPVNRALREAASRSGAQQVTRG